MSDIEALVARRAQRMEALEKLVQKADDLRPKVEALQDDLAKLDAQIARANETLSDDLEGNIAVELMNQHYARQREGV